MTYRYNGLDNISINTPPESNEIIKLHIFRSWYWILYRVDDMKNFLKLTFKYFSTIKFICLK